MHRFGLDVGFALLAIVSTVSAQSQTVPAFRPPVKTNSSGMQISHPDELQRRLEDIANELAAAGLADEARVVLDLRQRLQNEHRRSLATAYQNSLETQIALNVRIFIVENEDAVNQAFGRLVNQPASIETSPAVSGHLSGKLSAADAKTVLNQLTKAKNLRICVDDQFTVLNGRTLRCLAQEPAPVPPAFKAHGEELPELIGTSLIVSAKVIRDKTIDVTLAAEISSPQQPGQPSKLTINDEVTEGEILINDHVRAWEKEVAEKRGPAWAKIPGVIKLVRYQTTSNVSRKLLVTVVPSIIKQDPENLPAPIKFTSEASFPTELAPALKPHK